jgi:hypothetical protein
MPAVKSDDIPTHVAKALQDAFYVTVGLGVMMYNRAQVQRRELEQRLRAQGIDVPKFVEERVRTIEERLRSIR